MFRSLPAALLVAPCLLAACLSDPQAHLDRGKQLAFERRPAEALAEFEEVLSIVAKKEHLQVRELLVPALKGAADICYLEKRDLPKAVDYYRELVARFPEVPEALEARSCLSDIYRQLGDRRAAVAELVALVQAFPKHEESHRYQYQVAKSYFDLRDFDQAIMESKALQERYPDSALADDAQMLIASSYLLMDKREQAVAAYAEVERRWPDSDLVSRAQFEQARVLSDLGALQQAIDVLTAALKTHPNPDGVRAEIARLRKRLAIRRPPRNPSHNLAFPEWYGAPERRPVAAPTAGGYAHHR